MKLFTTSVIAMLFVLGASCSTKQPKLLETPTEVEVIGQVGTVDVTVVSVMPFKEYRAKLSQSVGITAEKAMTRVETITQSDYRRDLSQLGFNLGRAFDDTGLFKNQTAAAAGTATPTVPTPSNPLDVTGLPRAKDLTPPVLGSLEPNLGMLLMTAMLQEALLLENYLKHAPIADDYDAYLVRLQITVMPRHPGLKLDAYSAISFLEPDEQKLPILSNLFGTSRLGIPKELWALVAPKSEAEKLEFEKKKQPVVLPLLVADNIESLSNERSSEDLKRFSVSVMSLLGPLKATDAGLGWAQDAIQSVIGRELRSLKTVSSMGPSGIKVVLGAQANPSYGYSMLRRSHYVTVLVAIPAQDYVPIRIDDPKSLAVKSPKAVVLTTRTNFINSETGKFLDIRHPFETLTERQIAWFSLEFRACLSHPVGEAVAKETLKKYKPEQAGQGTDLGDSLAGKELAGLIDFARRGDIAGFKNRLPNTGACNWNSLWTALVEAADRGRVQEQLFSLAPVAPVFLPPEQPAFVERKKDAIAVSLFGGLRLDQLDPLTASLQFKNKTNKGDSMAAVTAASANGGRSLVAIFPAIAEDIEQAQVTFRWAKGTDTWPKAIGMPRTPKAAAEDKQRILFTLSGTTSLYPEENKADMQLEVVAAKPAGKASCDQPVFAIDASPAVIKASSSPTVQIAGSKAVLKQAGGAILELVNVPRNRELEFVVREVCGDEVAAVSKPMVVRVY